MYSDRDLEILKGLYKRVLRDSCDSLKDKDSNDLKLHQRESLLILTFIRGIETGRIK